VLSKLYKTKNKRKEDSMRYRSFYIFMLPKVLLIHIFVVTFLVSTVAI